jgi:hypothetical protein
MFLISRKIYAVQNKFKTGSLSTVYGKAALQLYYTAVDRTKLNTNRRGSC